MATLSGVSIDASKLGTEEFNVPSLIDIIVGQSRIFRFAGQTRVPCSVLTHSISVANVCEQVSNAFPRLNLSPHIKGLGILHDACEAVVSDVPSPFKSQQQKDIEDKITKHILDKYLPVTFSEADWAIVHAVDAMCAHSEAYVFKLNMSGFVNPENIHDEDYMIEYAASYLWEYKELFVDAATIDMVVEYIFDVCNFEVNNNRNTPILFSNNDHADLKVMTKKFKKAIRL